jgi:hypothetical protein
MSEGSIKQEESAKFDDSKDEVKNIPDGAVVENFIKSSNNITTVPTIKISLVSPRIN